MSYSPGVNADTYPTLLDVAQRSGKDGKIAVIAEMLTETNQMLEDAVFLEANDGSNNKSTVRTGLPTAVWRQLNRGVQPSKSKTAQVTDSTGMLEAYAEVDKALVDLNGNTKKFRLTEEEAFLETMNQSMAETLIYGDTNLYPERFMGLAPRYGSIGTPDFLNKGAAKQYGEQVIDMGGTGSNLTSMWLMTWGPSTAFMIYPKGSKAGLHHKDLGEQTLMDNDGGRFQGYRSHYKWDTGLVVRDWRYIVRVANIDLSATSPIDYKKLIKAIHTLPTKGKGRTAFYASRGVSSALAIDAAEKANVQLSIKEAHGKPYTDFWGVPIRQTDAILEAEAQVVAA